MVNSDTGPPTKHLIFELPHKKRPWNGRFSSTPSSCPPLIVIRSIKVRFQSRFTYGSACASGLNSAPLHDDVRIMTVGYVARLLLRNSL